MESGYRGNRRQAGVRVASPHVSITRLALCDEREILRTGRSRAVAFLEMRGDLIQRPVTPFLGLGEQLPAVFGMKRGALAVQGFHRTAVSELFHRHLPDSVELL